MDKKQITIFNNILIKFGIPNNVKFIQHRNLREFKYFKIEKINPTHILYIYGVLKNNNKKKETSKSLIKVGELILVFTFMLFNYQLVFNNFNFICLIFSMFFIACWFFYWFGDRNILRSIYDYWNRRVLG